MGLLIGMRQLGRDLASQKLRTFLTAFGIVWGTAAISLLLAFGEGFHKQILVNSAGLGENIVIAFPSLTSIPFEGLGKGRRILVDEEDIDLVEKGLAGISGEYADTFKLLYNTRTLPVDVSGVRPVFGDLRNLIPQEGGRFVNALDELDKRRVIFLGNELAKEIFGSTEPVGKTVMLLGSPFTVVGVLKEKTQDSSYSGRDKDKAFVPGSTFRALTGAKYVDNLIFKATGTDATEGLKADVIRVLAGRHRFDPSDKEALQMWDTTEGFKFIDTFMLAFRAFLGIVGSLTLIVGGIGVSNIMNVVVEERTREIGIKMALGARAGSILRQFMAETMLITIFSGAIGLLLAAAICAVFPEGFREFVGKPVISPSVGLLTAGLLGLIGFLAGYFPARDASRLDPVVAMKL
ncbi:MAG: ABC transporter permease [Acidobacteria bacterium]|nr:ABC transporter permease [Acidobacteriota bacterium]